MTKRRRTKHLKRIKSGLTAKYLSEVGRVDGDQKMFRKLPQETISPLGDDPAVSLPTIAS